MRKDPTEFRKRFAAWKNGKLPYLNGRISDELYVETMEKVARDNWQQWGDESEDASLTRILNDNSYDYRGYYNKYPKGVGNAQNHWTDEFKTVWHPSFSIESKYSGKKSQYNPYGYPGGTWQGEFFTPLWYQQNPNAPGFYKDGYPRIPKYKDGKLPKYEDGNEGYLNNFVNFGIGMIPIVGSIHDTYHAIKDPSLVNILSAGAGWGLDAMMLLGPAGVAIRQAGKAALKAKRAADAGKSLYRINKNTQLAKRQAQTAVKTALVDNRKLDAAVQLGQEAYDQYKQEYKNGKLPGYEDGTPTWFDLFREDHPNISTTASFLPIVGTAMDVYDAYKDPSAANIGYALLSGATDLFGGKLIMKAAGEAIKRHKAIKNITKSLEKEYSSWDYYKNMQKNEAKRLIKYSAKREAERTVGIGDLSDEMNRYLIPVATYFPDFLANIEQQKVTK